MAWTIEAMTRLVALIDELPLHSAAKLSLFHGRSFRDVARIADQEGLTDVAQRLRQLADQGLRNPNRRR
jgi:hypothetical protein